LQQALGTQNRDDAYQTYACLWGRYNRTVAVPSQKTPGTQRRTQRTPSPSGVGILRGASANITVDTFVSGDISGDVVN
jgi:hypothetical protein